MVRLGVRRRSPTGAYFPLASLPDDPDGRRYRNLMISSNFGEEKGRFAEDSGRS